MIMPRRMFDFRCEDSHTTERYIDTSTLSVKCEECGEKSKIEFSFNVLGWPTKRKIPNLRKRIQNAKKLKKNNQKHKETDAYNNKGLNK